MLWISGEHECFSAILEAACLFPGFCIILKNDAVSLRSPLIKINVTFITTTVFFSGLCEKKGGAGLSNNSVLLCSCSSKAFLPNHFQRMSIPVVLYYCGLYFLLLLFLSFIISLCLFFTSQNSSHNPLNSHRALNILNKQKGVKNSLVVRTDMIVQMLSGLNCAIQFPHL